MAPVQVTLGFDSDTVAKVGLAPRLFLKKLVGEVLDRIELFPDFDPRRNYELTLSGGEMSLDEKEAATVDDIELSL